MYYRPSESLGTTIPFPWIEFAGEGPFDYAQGRSAPHVRTVRELLILT